jgi:histone-lysine N-methyltransferase SETMAR
LTSGAFAHSQKCKVKTLLIAFFYSDGIIHKEFVSEGQTVNSEFYEQVMKRLLQRIPLVRLELYRTGQWMLLHDNAPAHCAIRVRKLMAQRGVPVLNHPPYSPDLVPADFFLFPCLKNIMRRTFCRCGGNPRTLPTVCFEGWGSF